jgi:hypothetical protein
MNKQSEDRRDTTLPIVLHHFSLTKLAKEILVVCNDDQLKVRMIFPLVDDTSKRVSTPR